MLAGSCVVLADRKLSVEYAVDLAATGSVVAHAPVPSMLVAGAAPGNSVRVPVGNAIGVVMPPAKLECRFTAQDERCHATA